jgi:GDPmannose 4,6-dehydratase
MPRALIVGHTGQDGRFLWDQLAERGFSLLGTSRTTVRATDEYREAAIDIADAGQVEKLVHAFAPDQIYFLAAHHQSSEEESDARSVWSASWSLHVDAFVNFLWAACRLTNRPRIFYASSSRVFGDAESAPQDETTPLKPVCVYGATKAAAMTVADYFRRVHDIFVSCGILFNHESSLRGLQFVSQRIVQGLVAIKAGRVESLVLGSLDARVDWGYASDYTAAMQCILDSDACGDFVIASGKTHSIKDFVAIAAETLGVDVRGRVVESATLLTRHSQELCGNSAKLRAATGWAPKISFEQMVEILCKQAWQRLEQRQGQSRSSKPVT